MDFKEEFRNLKAQQSLLRKKLKTSAGSLVSEEKKLTEEVEDLKQLREIVIEATRVTQVRVQEYVESLVTMAIQAVYDRPLTFHLQFVSKANRLQCIPLVKEGEDEYDLEYDEGGGLLDVVSFAFRVVLWSLQTPRSRPTFVLDEPMKFVGKGKLLDRAGSIFRTLSKKLNLQLIITTHEPQLADIADKAFLVTHNGTHSVVTEVVEGLEDTEKENT